MPETIKRIETKTTWSEVRKLEDGGRDYLYGLKGSDEHTHTTTNSDGDITHRDEHSPNDTKKLKR